MRTRIKFCGLVREVDVDAAAALGVDYVGFVFYPPSPRAIDVETATRLRRRLPSWVRAVGLFVNAPAGEVAYAATAVGLDVLQFHGDETPAQCVEAAGRRPWWRAIRVRSQVDLLHCSETFRGGAHPPEAMLLDAWSDGYGGSGKAFDWDWIEGTSLGPVVLSGGLDADTVGEAIRRVRPAIVDVSSGIQVESPQRDARAKDPARMAAFVAAVVAADARAVGATASPRP